MSKGGIVAVAAVALAAGFFAGWGASGKARQANGIPAAPETQSAESATAAAKPAPTAALAPAPVPAAAQSQKPSDTAEAKGDAAGAPATANAQAKTCLAVLSAKYNDDDRVEFTLAARPDMDVVRQYVTVEPAGAVAPSFRLTESYGVPALHVSGDFAYRTNVTIRLRSGFPAAESSLKPLEQDYVFSFVRPDRPQRTDFAHSGRYLPPDGPRAVLLKSVNVTNIAVSVYPVVPANIVNFLALEEDAYSHVRTQWWVDGEEFATDFSGEPDERTVGVDVKPNAAVETPVVVSGRNGVYFVRVRGEDKVAGETGRLICISDIGLSVREAQGKLLAWATSLTSGLPLGGVEVTAYSTGGAVVARGVTGADGLAMLDKVGAAEPFAVVASIAAPDGSVADSTFLALRDSMAVDEKSGSGDGEYARFLKSGETEAFVWTDRGIYRHGETILLHAIVRDADGEAPEPFPLVARLFKPSGEIYASVSIMPDALGSIAYEGFRVDADQPGGVWRLELATPGDNGRSIGRRTVRIEEFAPPTIRVKVEPARDAAPTNFSFRLSAEHLYGGAARNLRCEGAVVFEDAAFTPTGWDGWFFGNESLGLKPSFRRLGKGRLDDNGANEFFAPLWESSGLPVAAVRATAEGTAFEDGGRPATARASATLHFYPFYIGSDLKQWMRRTEGAPLAIQVACVASDGAPLPMPKALSAKLERIDSVYSYRRNAQGWATWDSEKVRTVVADAIPFEVPPGEPGVLELPAYESGDWCVTVTDQDTGVSFSRSFYLSSWGDEEVRAPLSDPTAVAISQDKQFYRPGESPRLIVKAPFAGTALLTMMRESVVYTQVVALTNATSEIALPPLERGMAPSIDVSICVVKGETASAGRLAVRAHGETTLSVRQREREIDVSLDAAVDFNADSGATVAVDVSAPGAETVLVALVDEGINILTDEPRPDPIGFFARKRSGAHPLYDLYHRLLPVVGDDAWGISGVKTGGGFGSSLLSRVSPVPTRRFVPLALWKANIPVKDGRAEAFFELPEFVGEVRVTAIACSAAATGAASILRKVAPKVVMEADAPRFAAPGDTFEISLSIANNSGAPAEIDYDVAATGPVALPSCAGSLHLDKGASKLLTFWATASTTGEAELVYSSSGCGERHVRKIHLPVRPGVPWIQKSGVTVLRPGETRSFPPAERESFKASPSPAATLAPAFDWLADYPHGCLEQTASRAFPLVASQDPAHAPFLRAAVLRVESMMRKNNFVMWPDCNYAPWDDEVSIYAAHFLVASGISTQTDTALRYLAKFAMSTNSSTSAYACHVLALAGKPEKDRMLRLYDERARLDGISRARLAGAFAAMADVPRAKELLAYYDGASPQSAKETAFALPALLDLDPADPRAEKYVQWLEARRAGRDSGAWETTEENAHALLALGEYFRRKGVRLTSEPAAAADVRREKTLDGATRFTNAGTADAFLSWRRLELPDAKTYNGKKSTVFSVERKFLTAEGAPADLAHVSRGDLLNAVITLTSAESRDYSDLVIEDLLGGGFEPVTAASEALPLPDWLMRTDLRDDRFLAFSKRFHLEAGEKVEVRYQVRAVTAGAFMLPGVSAEAMYFPELASRAAPSNVAIVDEDDGQAPVSAPDGSAFEE